LSSMVQFPLFNPFPPQPFEKGFFGQALCVLGRMFGETLEDLTLALDILTPFLGMVLGEPSEFMQEQRLPFGIAIGLAEVFADQRPWAFAEAANQRLPDVPHH